MPVTETLMAQGNFVLSLDLALTPNYIIGAIQPWDQVIITDTQMDEADLIDSVVLPNAEYVGVIQSLGIEPETAEIEGAGLSIYLGDSDNRGLGVSEIDYDYSKPREYKSKTLEYVINNNDGQPYGLLRNNQSGNLRTVYPGTITEKTIEDTDLLLNFEGTDGDQTYKDETDAEHVLNFYKEAEISSDQAQFGNTSLYLDGNSHVDILTHPDFHPNVQDFTIEWWEYRLDPS